MKVFTATFFRNNYGSALQAYALQQKIKELGGEPILIEKKVERKKKNLVEKIMIFFRPEKHYGPIRKIRRYLQKKIHTEKTAKINEFIELHTKVMSYETALKEIESNDCILLSGSDQVWSTLNHEIDGFYLFDFVHNEKTRKVSYAASIGVSELTEEQLAYYRKALKDFSAVSLREKAAYDLLKGSLDNKIIRQDLDPTLLFDGDFWNDAVSLKKPNRQYVFVYMLRPRNEVIKVARRLAKSRGLDIIYMGLYTNHYRGIKTIADGGVEDFLYYIKNADYVVTNSFHGTVFSILFEKHFVSCRIASTVSRAESLLELVGLKNHLIDKKTDFSVALEDYDYEDVKRRLAIKREESIEYLKSVILKK